MYVLSKKDRRKLLHYVCTIYSMYGLRTYVHVHTEVSYISFVYSIIGGTPSKSEICTYYICMCMYSNCLVGRRAHLWLGKFRSYYCMYGVNDTY